MRNRLLETEKPDNFGLCEPEASRDDGKPKIDRN
jgi:hypothetical protein